MLEFVYTCSNADFFAYGAALSTLIAETTLHTIEWSDEVISIYYILSPVFFP